MINAWKPLLSLFAFLSLGAHGEETSSCSATESSFNQTSEQLQKMKNCLEAITVNWTTQENAKIFNQLLTMTDIIQRRQNAEVKKLLPGKCPAPLVPSNGGLLCVSAEQHIYCKPMCNADYDFNFMRRSRLYEECNAATKFNWTTQYVGGNRLADCTKSQISVAGASSAYFPKDEDCHLTKSDEQLTKNITKVFYSELMKAGITSFNLSCLLCGQSEN